GPQTGALVASHGGERVYGVTSEGAIWRLAPGTGRLEPEVCRLPGVSGKMGFTCAWCEATGSIYLADAASGTIFSYCDTREKPVELGRTPLTPVKCLTATCDGRLFGFCGDQIEHLFSYEPASGRIDDLGIALSVLGCRRYGYQFKAAAPGPDGEIYFGESDRGGHLWVYFPSLKRVVDPGTSQEACSPAASE
ncbi:unnamed protein product, partial [marine sediment metagenome]